MALAERHGLTVEARGYEPPAASVVREAVASAAAGAATAAGAVTTAVAGAATGVVAGAATDFLDALADRLAVGVAAVVAILDPGCLVLAGEVGQAGGADLAARVERRVRRMSPLPTEVRVSALGGGAVLRGALLTARERAQDELFAPLQGRGALPGHAALPRGRDQLPPARR